jgi:uracil-DNA glycosylase
VTSRVLLVGEDNPLSSHPSDTLVPWPEGCSGHRLLNILGLAEETYLALHRANLCRGRWSTAEAKRRAALLIADPSAPWRVIVMLGRKVANAFGCKGVTPFSCVDVPGTELDGPMRLVTLPHPSGRNTIWTIRAKVEQARALMREVAPEVPWGTFLPAAPLGLP